MASVIEGECCLVIPSWCHGQLKTLWHRLRSWFCQTHLMEYSEVVWTLDALAFRIRPELTPRDVNFPQYNPIYILWRELRPQRFFFWLLLFDNEQARLHVFLT